MSFLQTVAKKVNTEDSQDAFVYASVAVARVKLGLGDTDGARKDLDDAEKLLDSFDSVETVVHAAFYDANANYYQVYPTTTAISVTERPNILLSSARWTFPTTTEPPSYTSPA